MRQKDKYHTITFICGILKNLQKQKKQTNSDMEKRLVVARGGVRDGSGGGREMGEAGKKVQISSCIINK